MTFDAGPQLQFLFHSDSSNNEWGYKFTVTALGLPDITISWMSDLQLLVARLMGRLGSRTLALKSPHGKIILHKLNQTKASVCLSCALRSCLLYLTLINFRFLQDYILPASLDIFRNSEICVLLCIAETRTVKELPPGKMSHVQSSPLWKPILRHGLCEARETNQTKTHTDQVCKITST